MLFEHYPLFFFVTFFLKKRHIWKLKAELIPTSKISVIIMVEQKSSKKFGEAKGIRTPCIYKN